MTNWYESDDPAKVARGASWRFGLMIIAALVVIGLIGVGVWGFKVATSDVKGKGDATATKNSAVNRIAAQEEFETLYADIVATDRKLDALQEAAEAPEATRVDRVNYTGTQNACLTLISDYDAAARQYTSADFRAVDLPAQIDILDPATDCQPTTH